MCSEGLDVVVSMVTNMRCVRKSFEAKLVKRYRAWLLEYLSLTLVGFC